MNGRPSVVIQGHGLSGGSSVNAMVHIRGDASGYDAWAQLGNHGWAYDDVLPVFRDLENNAGIADGYHGRTGELHVSDPEYRHPLSEAFLAAARASGLPGNRDFNGARLEGVGCYQTMTQRGRRASAARAFPRPAERRPNLEVLTSARVAGIRFEGRRATGVTLEDGRRRGAR